MGTDSAYTVNIHLQSQRNALTFTKFRWADCEFIKLRFCDCEFLNISFRKELFFKKTVNHKIQHS